jgi:hypothetical protein
MKMTSGVERLLFAAERGIEVASVLLPLSPWTFGECQSQERELSIAGENSEWFNDGIFPEKLQRGKNQTVVFASGTNDPRNINNERGEE